LYYLTILFNCEFLMIIGGKLAYRRYLDAPRQRMKLDGGLTI
jgi:hypothetical protein